MKRKTRRLLCLLLTLLLMAGLNLQAAAETEPEETAEAASENATEPAEETAPESTPEPTPEPSPEPTPKPEPTPEATPAPLVFPDGSVHQHWVRKLDLSSLEHEQLEETIALLHELPQLHTVDLGCDWATQVKDWEFARKPYDPAYRHKEERLSWEDIAQLVEEFPEVDFQYRFMIQNRAFNLLDERFDVHHLRMDDEGALVKRILPCLKNCSFLDMDFCNVSSEAMAELRDSHPELEVVWRVWFGTDCSVRTDVERILASNLNHHLTDNNSKELKYCTKVKYLDLGHNSDLHDYSFVSYMPDLEVAVISISGFRDLTPFSSCTNLEYLEMCNYRGQFDLAPLGALVNLKHLNICSLGEVTGYEELMKLDKLERLWIGCYTYIPEEWVEEFQAQHPDCVVNTTEQTGCLGSWRAEPDGSMAPRYALLREQFEYDRYPSVCSSFYNDPMYYG